MGKGTNLLYIRGNCQGYSDEIQIDDLEYYNPGNSVSTLQIDSGVSVTSNGEYITIGSTSSEKYVYLPITLANSDNWEFSTTIARKDTNKVIGGIFNDESYYYTSDGSNGKYRYSVGGGSIGSNISCAVGDIITIRRQNGVTTILINNTQIGTHTISHKSSFKCGYYTFGNAQHIKNIKMRKL